MMSHLFFYGTLMAGFDHPLARGWRGALAPEEPGRVAGRLFAIADPQGWYPALLPGEGWVRGMVHRLLPTFDTGMLAAMDHYEGAQYCRLPVSVMLGEGKAMAQAYVWQGALPAEAVALEDGDFAAFLEQSGEPAYRGS